MGCNSFFCGGLDSRQSLPCWLRKIFGDWVGMRLIELCARVDLGGLALVYGFFFTWCTGILFLF